MSRFPLEMKPMMLHWRCWGPATCGGASGHFGPLFRLLPWAVRPARAVSLHHCAGTEPSLLQPHDYATFHWLAFPGQETFLACFERKLNLVLESEVVAFSTANPLSLNGFD